MTMNGKDILGLMDQIDARLKEYQGFDEVCARMVRESQEAQRLRDLQRSVDSDLEEGSVESLLRAKDKVNALLDGMIKRALDTAV
jgi:hypothetical protein